MFSSLSYAFGWKPVGELDEPKARNASNQSILVIVRRMGSLKQEPSMTDADDGGSYDKADGCKDDDEVDVIDDGGDGGVG